MGKIIKETFFWLCVLLGATRYFRWRNRKKILILMYHGVVEQPLEPFCWTQLDKDKFEYQLRYLKRNHTVLKLSELIDTLQCGRPLLDYTAVVTFDDGYRNNYTIAYPLLRQYQIPAVIFLATRCVSEQVRCWPDILYLAIKHSSQEGVDLSRWNLQYYPLGSTKEREIAYEDIVEYLKILPRAEKDRILKEIVGLLKDPQDLTNTDFDLMSWEEAISLRETGFIELGSHTATHNILSRMNESEAAKEIYESCESILEYSGARCDMFAYPNGRRIDFTDKVKDLLKRHGLRCALTTIPGLNDRSDDLLEMKRVGIGADISNARFKCLVSALSYQFKNVD